MPPIMTKPPIVTPVRCNDASEGACPFVRIRMLNALGQLNCFPPRPPAPEMARICLHSPAGARSDAAKMDAGELVQVGQA